MLHNLRIGTRLAAGFSLVLLFTAVIGVAAVFSAQALSGLTRALYEHPFKVTRALLTADTDVLRISTTLRGTLLAHDSGAIDSAASQIEQLDKTAFEQLAIAYAQSLGNQQGIQVIGDALRNWKPTRDKVIALARSGKLEDAIASLNDKAGPQVIAIQQNFDKALDFAHNKAELFMQSSDAASSRTIG